MTVQQKLRKDNEAMIKKDTVQRITAAVLITALAVTLAGCGARKTVQNGIDETGEKGTTAAAAVEVAKGRYVETAVSLPFEDNEERVLDLIQLNDGSLELLTLRGGDGGENKAYRYDGLSWSEEERSPGAELPAGSTLFYTAYGKDGFLYMLYADKEYQAYLTKIPAGADGEGYNVAIEDSIVLVNGLYVKDDGTVLIPSGDSVLVMGTEGEVKNKLPQRNSSSNFADSHTLTASSFLTTGDQGFLRYDTENWKEKEVIPFQRDESDLYGSLAAGTGDDFYLANATGIHHMADQGTMWETVVDGTLNSMGMPSVLVKRLFVGNSNDFYLWYVENENSRLAHYIYDADMPSVPTKTITVYGLDLTGNKTVKQAASLFQMENPDTRVELIDGAVQSGSTVRTDTIRSLNAELLNGAGADVLVLDGLPSDSYVEKGILEDLSDTVTPMAESGELYANIAKSFTEADGSIYQFPVRVTIPIIYGEKTGIDATESLETLSRWQKENPQSGIFPKTVYENILRQMIYLYYPELKSDAAGQLDKEKVRFLLETAKKTGDASGAKVIFDETEDNDMVRIYNEVAVKGFSGLGDYSLMRKEAVVSLEMIGGMYDVMIPYALSEKYGYELQQFQDLYFPEGLLGVTKFSKEKETAREFVKFALSLNVQKNDLSDGFPVNKKAAEVWRGYTSEISMGMSYDGLDDRLNAEYPNEEKKKEVLGMIDRLQTPITVDNVLLEMMVSETKGYFEGTQTVEEAAGQFENKAKLYYAE